MSKPFGRCIKDIKVLFVENIKSKIQFFATRARRHLNVDPDLEHFKGIVPCGVSNPRYGTTSLAKLCRSVTMLETDVALRREFEPLFGKTEAVPGDPPELRLTIGAAAR